MVKKAPPGTGSAHDPIAATALLKAEVRRELRLAIRHNAVVLHRIDAALRKPVKMPKGKRLA